MNNEWLDFIAKCRSGFVHFRANPKGFEGKVGQTLSERIFNLKVDLIRELQDMKYDEEDYRNYRSELLKEVFDGINALNEDNFRVRINLYYVHKYKNTKEWESLGAVMQKE